MPIARALPGTLGVLALVLVPSALAMLNLCAGLAQIHARESSSTPSAAAADLVVVATWEEA